MAEAVGERTGSLTEGSVLEVLRALSGEQITGVLHLTRHDEHLRLRLVNGQVVSGSSGAPDRIGDVLVRCGLVEPSDLEHALAEAQRQGRRLGPVLCELGLVARDRLEDALRLQVRGVLFTALFWRDGAWVLEPGDPPIPLPEDGTLRLSTSELLMEAVHRIADQRVLREALGDLDCPLAAAERPPVRLEGQTLGPADGFVLSRVDGTLSGRQLLALSSLPTEEVLRSLLALLAAGVIERRPAVRSVVHRSGAPSRSDPPAPPRIQPEADRPVFEARTLGTTALEGKDHFAVLGVGSDADSDQVKAAYLALVRRFHPDALPASSPRDLKEKARALFVRINEAYGVLHDPESRATYRARLEPRPTPEKSAGSTARRG